MKKFRDNLASHLIAVNYHGFHNTNVALDCLHSVLQSAKGVSGHVKIIFFNHSGRPASPELVTGLFKLNVILVELPNNSNGENLNKQIEWAKGYDFFYRVDADDLVSQGRFKWQADLLANSNCDICGGGLIYHNIKTGTELKVMPVTHPKTMSYLGNQYFMHPTLAFNLESFKRTNLRYGIRRLEDKDLALSAYNVGLSITNDQRIYGTYNLNPNARNDNLFARRNLELNLAFIRATHNYWALPFVYTMFLFTLLISQNMLRKIRATITLVGTRTPTSSSEFSCENTKAEKGQKPSP
jgi:hypothetical protein